MIFSIMMLFFLSSSLSWLNVDAQIGRLCHKHAQCPACPLPRFVADKKESREQHSTASSHVPLPSGKRCSSSCREMGQKNHRLDFRKVYAKEPKLGAYGGTACCYRFQALLISPRKAIELVQWIRISKTQEMRIPLDCLTVYRKLYLRHAGAFLRSGMLCIVKAKNECRLCCCMPRPREHIRQPESRNLSINAGSLYLKRDLCGAAS